jgi:ADP-ribose pyrophosphatase YjhB (NUDIX family)
MIESLMRRYPNALIEKVDKRLSGRDFADQKRKQDEYPIEGASLGIIVVDSLKNEIVLAKRTKPHRGWSLPGGRVEKGEEFDEALKREILEECGLDIAITRLLAIEDKRFYSPTNEVISIWLAIFEAQPVLSGFPHTTLNAIKEGLIIKTFSVGKLPAEMILNDEEKIKKYLSSRS